MTPIELRARRIRLGMSQQDLAGLLGVKQASVSRWEAGTSRPGPGIVVALGELEDAFEDLLQHLADAAAERDGQIPAGASIELDEVLTVEGRALPVPVGMVLSAAAHAWWLLNGEAEDGGRPPEARIV